MKDWKDSNAQPGAKPQPQQPGSKPNVTSGDKNNPKSHKKDDSCGHGCSK